ncbi:hypothetical protein D3C75_919310 [compost metagenome]
MNQISLADFGDQCDLRCTGGFFGGQVLLQRGVTEALHPAEQIQLVFRQRQADLIVAGNSRPAVVSQIRRQALTIARCVGIQPRYSVGALDAVLRPGLLDIQKRLAQ